MKLWAAELEMVVKAEVAEDKKAKTAAEPAIMGVLSFQFEAESFEKAVEWIHAEAEDLKIISLIEQARPAE